VSSSQCRRGPPDASSPKPPESARSFTDRDTVARTAAGWDRGFARIDALLGGAPLDEATAAGALTDLYGDYAADFDVDPELGRRAFAEHLLR